MRKKYRSLLHTLLCGTVRFTLAPALVRFYVRRRVTIVNYHKPDPLVFERHLCVFARLYSLISLDRLVAAMARDGFSGLPSRCMVITIDECPKCSCNALGLPLCRSLSIASECLSK